MKSAFSALGFAAYNMSYRQFCQALGMVENDQYARDKYQDLKDLGRCMGYFTDSTLVALVEAYQAAQAARTG
jgi:hypothetical protein